MAFAEITFKNPQTGEMKIAPVGFSWTILFFGPIPISLRGGSYASSVFWVAITFFTFPIMSTVAAFIYNKIFIKNLIKKGFKVTYISTGDLNYASAKLGMRLPIIEEEFKKNMNSSFY